MRYILPAILLAVLAAALVWQATSHGPKQAIAPFPSAVPSPVEAARVPLAVPEPVTAEETPGTVEDTGKASSTEAAPLKYGRAETVPSRPEYSARSASLESSAGPEITPGLSPGIVLENMRSVFRQFSLRFGGNPVGTNPEITAALNGKNPRQVVFLDPEGGMRINGRGELVDNWGTPYFFHQLSGTQMEVRSAGPDHKMWTTDDLVIR